MRILAVDVGGTNVKVLLSGSHVPRKVPSGSEMTARAMVAAVKQLTQDWRYDVVSLGYPGPVLHGKPVVNPKNLGGGWVGFDFARAFGKPVRIVNDAAMQALGSYQGGRMLFLGLGTGLGSAIVSDGVLSPLELAHLPYRKHKSFEDFVGLRGLEKLGRKKWEKHVHRIVKYFANAVDADYIVLGGGNAKKLKAVPAKCRLGDNSNAIKGGLRMWAKV